MSLVFLQPATWVEDLMVLIRLSAPPALEVPVAEANAELISSGQVPSVEWRTSTRIESSSRKPVSSRVTPPSSNKNIDACKIASNLRSPKSITRKVLIKLKLWIANQIVWVNSVEKISLLVQYLTSSRNDHRRRSSFLTPIRPQRNCSIWRTVVLRLKAAW